MINFELVFCKTKFWNREKPKLLIEIENLSIITLKLTPSLQCSNISYGDNLQMNIQVYLLFHLPCFENALHLKHCHYIHLQTNITSRSERTDLVAITISCFSWTNNWPTLYPDQLPWFEKNLILWFNCQLKP